MSLLAAGGYTAWGVYANWEHGPGARWQVGLTQGVLGLVATFVSAELVVWLVGRFLSTEHPVLFTGIASWLIIYGVVWVVHLTTGTPEVLKTMLPGMVIGIFFSFGYSRRVHRWMGRN